MKQLYKILAPGDLKDAIYANKAFALDVLNGLSEHPKRLQSKYFYDDEGSRLFQEIMGLPEYYLTNCEYEILQTHKETISQFVSNETFNIIELGAGDGLKTSILIEYFQKSGLDFRYVPVDISEAAMQTLTRSMKQKFTGMDIFGLVAEYFEGLKWLSTSNDRRNIVLILGSNLGNFSKSQAKAFLRTLWNSLNNDDIVVTGFDVKKDIDLMLDAYNDAQGVTAKFNLNLLRRINRELGGNFDLNRFRFFATYNVFSGAMESYLVSLEAQKVFVKDIGQTFSFKEWEPIHTEYSYKFLESDIINLAESTGYAIEKQLYDSKRYFVDSVWRVEKQAK